MIGSVGKLKTNANCWMHEIKGAQICWDNVHILFGASLQAVWFASGRVRVNEGPVQ